MNEQTAQMEIAQLTAKVEQLTDIIAEMASESRPILGGERYLTDKELMAKIPVSKRTLQTWRSEGLIPYMNIGGKVLYRESDVESLFESFYINAYAQA